MENPYRRPPLSARRTITLDLHSLDSSHGFAATFNLHGVGMLFPGDGGLFYDLSIMYVNLSVRSVRLPFSSIPWGMLELATELEIRFVNIGDNLYEKKRFKKIESRKPSYVTSFEKKVKETLLTKKKSNF